MSIVGNPLQKSPERAFTLQKYLLLHSQHDALQKHLESISQPASASDSTSASSSLSNSPPTPTYRLHHQRHHKRSSSTSLTGLPPSLSLIPEHPSTTATASEIDNEPAPSPTSRPILLKRRSSLPPSLPTAPQLSEVEEEELKLLNVNQQIKSTLTELLNCESVRGDRRYRMWIQTRLMDTERELKGRRWTSLEGARRGSSSVGVRL